ncbi:MAG: hypothetical protein R3A11_08785 [Bdellovibrionota bacterium]
MKTVSASPMLDISPSSQNDVKLAKILWLLADEFDLKVDDLVALLDVKERTIYKCRREGTLPLSSSDRYRRIGLLLGIKKNLEIIFPRNPEVRSNWLHIKRKTFRDKSAIELVKESPVESMARLFTIRRLLDMQRNGTINSIV